VTFSPTLNDADKDGLRLTVEEQAMLSGELGQAIQITMSILVRVAPLFGATSLMPITRAHIDGCIYEGDAGVEFAERLAAGGGKVAVPTSLNVISLDRARWRSHGLDAAYAEKADRLARAYLAMGAKPNFTCAPYQTEHAPKFGEQIAWAESNAVAFANSVIGARTNRYGDYLDISCALTGRVPAAGLHLSDNRFASLQIDLVGVPQRLQERDDFFPVLGYLIGTVAGDEIPVITGLDCEPSDDQLKSLAAAAASSGAVAMFHLAGITPEAATLEVAIGRNANFRRIDVGMEDLNNARASLTTARGDGIDLVAFGSPHCSLAECQQLAHLMTGQRAKEGVKVFITTSRGVREILDRTGDLRVLEQFGATVTADTCIVVAPLVPAGAQVLMTNSAKYAHYGPGILAVDSVFASTEDCIASAIAGRVTVDDSDWMKA
jgi:cis-L-3-hydroxyproline dehydratase